ncbi:MAG: peptidylprolyl isomerase [Ignavibacteria bacterium]|nr:peptidylprolyl isomerase [Ignavibacteria bacterium]
MKKVLLSLLGISGMLFLAGCLGSNAGVVAKFGDEKISYTEYQDAYTKNFGIMPTSDSVDASKAFLKLYTNFKMKLADAKARGFEKNVDLQNELLDYKKKIGVTYLLDRKLVEPNLHRLWELRKNEYRVSHIMFRPDSSGEAKLLVKANAILDSIIKFGKPFEEMARKYSQDNYSAKLGGDVFFFTPLLLRAPEFEEAYISTPVGGVYPAVVKTQFGWHIIKVTEKKVRVPQIRASHIMAMFSNEAGKIDTVRAKQHIDSVYQMLQNGGNFEEIAKKYSEDRSTAVNGGDLNFFERRMMVPEFDVAAFNLKKGEISGIVRTMYGYHIIKITDQKPYPKYEDDKEALKGNYQMYRYQGDYDTLAKASKTRHGYMENAEGINAFVKAAGDTSKFVFDVQKNSWYNTVRSTVLFNLNGAAYTVDSLFNFALSIPETNAREISKATVTTGLKKYTDQLAIEAEALDLPKVNPEFASLMEDYKNGIFIFKLQEEEVWNKIQLDSAKLVAYYNANKDSYKWSDRVSYVELFFRGDSATVADYQKRLKAGEPLDSLAAKYTQRAGMQEKAGLVELTEVDQSDISKAAAKLVNPGDISPIINNEGGMSIVKLVKKEAARVKTFEEAKAEVSGAYQEQEAKRLEEAYLQTLQKKYEPTFYYDNLQKPVTK